MCLNPRQVKTYNKLLKFIKKQQEDPQFLLNGEAGAGKTFTIIYTLSKIVIPENKLKKYNFFFLAPTNAAKKVLHKTFLDFVRKTYPEKMSDVFKTLEKKNSDNYNSIKTIYFKTMHSFFKSKRKFDSKGNIQFDINPYNNILAEVVGAQRDLLGKKSKYNIKNIVILDESSMIGPDKYELFKQFIEINKENNIRVIYIGDKNQLTYIEDKDEDETDEKKLNKKTKKEENYFSPIFSHIENKILLTGNERTNNENITKVVNRLKKCVINNSFTFRLKKNDICDNIKLIVDNDIIKSPMKEIIKKDCPKIISFSNKRRIYLNDVVRKIIYGKSNHYLNEYLFLNNERIMVENTFMQEEKQFFNMDEYIIKSVKYDILEKINFFGEFEKPYLIEKIILDEGSILFQICKSQLNNFKSVIKLFKLCINDYVCPENRMDKCFGLIHKCPVCNCTKTKCRFYDKTHIICEECYKKFIDFIDKKYICTFCGSLNDHTKCPVNPKPLNVNSIKKIKDELYDMIQNYSDMYNPPITYSYAITTYKSQGSTYDEVIVDYDDIYRCTVRDKRSLTRSMYVSVSRVRKTLYFLNYFQK